MHFFFVNYVHVWIAFRLFKFPYQLEVPTYSYYKHQ